MSKDKGGKNSKKPKADKNTGKKKKVAAYKTEGLKEKEQEEPYPGVYTSKPGHKTRGGHKKKQ